MKDKVELVKNIIINLGGVENITKAFHCMTRLRFNVIDKNLINVKEINGLPGVLGAKNQSGQFQIIIGNKVNEVYVELAKELKIIDSDSDFNLRNHKKSKISFNSIIDVISSLFGPIIGIIAGAGIFKGVTSILTTYAIDPNSDFAIVLNLMGDCAINVLPILLAYTASKKFDVDTGTSIAIAGVLIAPAMILSALPPTEPTAYWYIGKLPIPIISYAGAIFPTIFAIYTLKWLTIGLDKIIPKVLRILLLPLISIIILIPLTLALFGPIGNYIGIGLAWIVERIFSWQPWVATMFLSMLWPIIVTFGMHYALFPVIFANLSTTTGMGYDYILASAMPATMAQAGAILGVFLLVKNKDNKQITAGASISAFIGITEPALYSGILKYKQSLFATLISGAVGGIIIGIFGGKIYSFGMPSILSLPSFYSSKEISGFISIVVSLFVSYGLAFSLTLLFRINEFNIKRPELYENIKWWNWKQKFIIWKQINKEDHLKNKNYKVRIKEALKLNVISKGSIYSLKELSIDDNYLGYGIKPKGEKISSPIDGVIETISDIKNAIVIKNNDFKILIHFGLESHLLKDTMFKTIVKEQQKVIKGETILTFDKNILKKQKINFISFVQVIDTKETYDIEIIKDYGFIFNENKGNIRLIKKIKEEVI